MIGLSVGRVTMTMTMTMTMAIGKRFLAATAAAGDYCEVRLLAVYESSKAMGHDHVRLFADAQVFDKSNAIVHTSHDRALPRPTA